jgi:tetratricopeptide (TPR) repeat protein
VWSLGVVMFEMLTGRRPFDGASRDALHHSILHDEPSTVTTLRPETPLALASIVARALARDPAERFQTAAELRWALAEARRAIEGSARARRRLLLGAAAAVTLLVSVGGIAILRPDPDADPEPVAEPLDEPFLRGRDRYFTGTAESNEAAIALFRSIVERDPTHVLARSYLAAAYAVSVRPDYSRRGRTEWLDSAEAHAHIALALAPDHPAPHAALGVVHRWAGRVDSALAHHRHALDFDPAYALSLLETGYLSHVSGRPDEAAILLERGLAIEPAVPAARQYATALYRAFDMPDDAHRHLVAGRTLAPDDASLIWETVMLALDAGDTTAARGEFDSYIQLIAPGERERMRAWYYILLGDMPAARSHIDRVDLTEAPAYDLRTFGVAYLRTGAVERGRALLERALADIAATSDVADWGYTHSEFHAAYVYAALGDAEASIAALEQWTANGGSRSWRRIDDEWVWRSLQSEPRFHDIVGITTARFSEKRSRVEAELRRRRD